MPQLFCIPAKQFSSALPILLLQLLHQKWNMNIKTFNQHAKIFSSAQAISCCSRLLNGTCSSGFVVAGLSAGFVTSFFLRQASKQIQAGLYWKSIDRVHLFCMHVLTTVIIVGVVDEVRSPNSAKCPANGENRVSHVDDAHHGGRDTCGESIRQPIWINKQEGGSANEPVIAIVTMKWSQSVSVSW